MKRDVLGAYIALQREYGDIVSFRTGPFRLYIFFHPDHVREVLVQQARSIIRVPRVMETFSQWNGRSILITEGDDWVRQRRLVQPGFQPRRFENYGRVMVDCTQRLIERWQPEIARQQFVNVNVRQAMTGLTLEIIGRTLFDVDLTADSGEISRAVAILSEVAFHEMQAAIRLPNWWPTDFYRRKRWAMRTLDDVVWRIVRARRAEGADRGDLLSMLLASVDEEGDGGQLSDRQVRDEAMTLMLAGHDTSAAALEWMCYRLAKHPDIVAKCREEIGRVIGTRDVTAADVAKLPYLQAVIKETLRLYPPAIGVFLRQAVKELQIGGYAIVPGSLLALSSYATHRDARWFSDPERFDPARFLPPCEEQIPAGAYFPFGAGPRVCIGQSFAMMEMTLIATTLLRHVNVSLPPGFVEPQPHVHISLRPDRPLTLRWSRRV